MYACYGRSFLGLVGFLFLIKRLRPPCGAIVCDAMRCCITTVIYYRLRRPLGIPSGFTALSQVRRQLREDVCVIVGWWLVKLEVAE